MSSPVPTQTVEIVLASASPRRQQLLAQIGVDCHVYPVAIDERAQPAESPRDYVARLASEKAITAIERIQQDPDCFDWLNLSVLGSDTCIEFDSKILGKPRDSAHAVEILTKLSGNTHFVHTAVCVANKTVCEVAVSTSQVSFAKLEETSIRHYVNTGEPMDKAGAYAIQGLAAQFIERLDGSFSGVMGLPLFETANLLRRAGCMLF